MADKPRVLIFIVAYNAEKTLETVLERIPYAELGPTTEILVIDDSSQDNTFQKGVEYRTAKAGFPLTILRTPVNQGYGGNQKLGYRYAMVFNSNGMFLSAAQEYAR